MSVINQMLRDLDQRAAQKPSSENAAPCATTPASAYAAARMAGGAVRHGRHIALACGVVAMLPIAWAATQYERPAGVPLVSASAPSNDPRAKQPDAPAAPMTPAAPTVARAEAAVALALAEPAARITHEPSHEPSTPRPTKVLPPDRVAMLTPPKADVPAPLPLAAEPARANLKEETRIERHPTDARDDLTRAGEAMAVGRVSEAIALLRKVIQAEPDNERARLALLSLLAERGRDDTWRALLADSARAMPTRFGMAAAQGMAESGRYEQGLAILQGLPESARDLRYFSALGATQQQLNQHAEAVNAFASALAMAPAGSPQTPALLVAQAVSMQSLGNVAEARRNLERVRSLPDAPADMRDFASRELAHSR